MSIISAIFLQDRKNKGRVLFWLTEGILGLILQTVKDASDLPSFVTAESCSVVQ